MNRLMFLVAVLVLAFLPACSPGNAAELMGERCNKLGCISIHIAQPVKFQQKTNLRIIIKPTEKAKVLRVSLSASGLESVTFDRLPENVRMITETEKNMGFIWEMTTEAEQEYALEGTVVLMKPSHQSRLYSYEFTVVIWTPGGASLPALLRVYMDSEGNQVDTEQVKEYLDEEPVLPNETGIIDFPTFTPAPTFPPPTPVPSATPMPTRTPTPTRTATQA
ncbi:MAG: hypothetical protein AB1453_04795, partial [Chloroflexota bacterium]